VNLSKTNVPALTHSTVTSSSGKTAGMAVITHNPTHSIAARSAIHEAAEAVHTAREFPRDIEPDSKHPSAPHTSPHKPSTAAPDEPRARRSSRQRSNRWLHYAAANRERGMSTAEYAVGTIAACAFAALLFKVVSSPEVQEMLSSLIDRALNTNG
jgi:hypothetical protein